MKSKRILAILLTLSMGASVALVGCGKSNDSAPAAENKTGMDKEQYLNVVLSSEPKILDSGKATDLTAGHVLNHVIEGLTRAEQKDGVDTIEPAGAEKWDVSEDGSVWTFHLRDYKWSDGKPVTAKDFAYGITRTLAKETAGQNSYLLFPIKNAMEFNQGKVKAEELGVKAIDDKTLEIKLAKPCAYFIELTCFKVMHPQRQDIIEKYGDKYGTELDTMVFCGPFVMKNWAHSSKIELEKNPTYWDAKSVKLDKITMKIINDPSARMNELYNSSIDSTGVSKPEWIKKFDETGRFDVRKASEGSVNFEFFNQKDKYFKNAKIRKAFVLAKDREGTSKTIFKGVFKPAYSWIPPEVVIGGEDFRKKANVDLIKKLQEENPDPKKLLIEGLKEIGENPDPAKMKVSYLQTGTGADSKEMGEFDQQSVKKVLGVNMNIEYVEFPIFQKRTTEGDFQMGGQAWGADYNDPMTFLDMWMTDANQVPTGWSNPKYDELVRKAQNSSDQAVRFEALKEAENILIYEDGVISPSVYRYKNTYRAKYVKNVISTMLGSGADYKYAYTQGRK